MFKILNNWTIFWSFVITVDLYIRFESYIQFHYIKDRAAYNCTIERHVISNLKMRKRFSKKEKNRVMAPSISAIFKIQLTAGDDILERFRLEAEWACRWLRDGPFTEIFLCCKSVVQIFNRKVEIDFWHALFDRPETMSFRTCVSKNAGDDKPLWFKVMCCTAFVVFLNGIQDLLCVPILIILDVTTKASFCPQWINVRVRRWFKSIPYDCLALQKFCGRQNASNSVLKLR